MRTIVAAPIGIIAISGRGVSAEHDAAPTVVVGVQGVRVVKAPPGGDDTLRAFNDVSGTTVGLIITVPQGGLVVFDSDSSRVKSFMDNKGKDLTKPEPGAIVEIRPEGWAFQAFPRISDDRKYCSVAVSMPGIPTKQATTLTLSGHLVLKIAKEKRDFTAEQVPLQAGAKINAGTIPLTIQRTGKPQFGADDAFEVQFQARQNLDGIARIQFFDATGKKIEAEEHGRGEGRWSGNLPTASGYEATLDYRLKSAVDAAKIVVTCWTDMKEVSMPFDLTVSLGL
jgi:hypothetical protein